MHTLKKQTYILTVTVLKIFSGVILCKTAVPLFIYPPRVPWNWLFFFSCCIAIKYEDFSNLPVRVHFTHCSVWWHLLCLSSAMERWHLLPQGRKTHSLLLLPITKDAGEKAFATGIFFFFLPKTHQESQGASLLGTTILPRLILQSSGSVLHLMK